MTSSLKEGVRKKAERIVKAGCHGIEPTFLKLDSWSPGVGFIPIITYNISNLIKKERM